MEQVLKKNKKKNTQVIVNVCCIEFHTFGDNHLSPIHRDTYVRTIYFNYQHVNDEQ